MTKEQYEKLQGKMARLELFIHGDLGKQIVELQEEVEDLKERLSSNGIYNQI